MNNGTAAFMTIVFCVASFAGLGFAVSTNSNLNDKVRSLETEVAAAQEEGRTLRLQVTTLQQEAAEWQHRAAASEALNQAQRGPHTADLNPTGGNSNSENGRGAGLGVGMIALLIAWLLGVGMGALVGALAIRAARHGRRLRLRVEWVAPEAAGSPGPPHDD